MPEPTLKAIIGGGLGPREKAPLLPNVSFEKLYFFNKVLPNIHGPGKMYYTTDLTSKC